MNNKEMFKVKSFRMDNLSCCEIIRTRSGDDFFVSESDICFFTLKLKEILCEYIQPDKTVGLFLPLDEMQFASLILYNACIDCGAAVIRCGISDIERQIPIASGVRLDFVISSRLAYKYISSKISVSEWIFIDDLETSCENTSFDEGKLVFYELYDIPAILIKKKNNDFICPGYSIVCKYMKIGDLSNSILTISTDKEIKGFEVENYTTNIEIKINNKKHSVKKILPKDFIMIQILYMLNGLSNCKINKRGQIFLDSIGMVELLVKLEEEFELSVPTNKIKKTDFSNTKNLAELIYSVIKEAGI